MKLKLIFILLIFFGSQDLFAYERIITVSGSVTEIVFALGAGEKVVAVDETSIYPEEVKELPIIGNYRSLSAEGVLSLNPDMIILNEDSGPADVIKQLESTNIKVVVVPSENSIDGVKKKIMKIAEALNSISEGELLVDEFENQIESVEKLIKENSKKEKALFIYARGQAVLNVAGSNTAADEMIKLSGNRNAADGFNGYKPLTSEALVAAQPDFIILTEVGLNSMGGVSSLLKTPGIELTPAGKNKRIVTVDDLEFLGFTPRLGKALKELITKIHPQLNENN